MKRMTIEQIREKANEVGCKLITDVYKDAHTKMEFQCICGEIIIKDWEHFKRGQNRCEICRGRINWDINKIRDYVDKNTDCKLVSTEYINRNKPMEFICACGNHFITTWHGFLYGDGNGKNKKQRCDECGINIKKEKLKTGIDILRQRTKEMSDCELLSDKYDDYATILDFRCSCGNTFQTCWTSFCNGKRACSICSPNSVMEYKTEEILNKYNISYIPQYSFDDLRSSKGYKLRFDFRININKDKFILLELDGELHFEEARFKSQDNTAKLKHQQECDMLKNEYCKNKNILLYRINYTKKENIEEEITNLLKELNLL